MKFFLNGLVLLASVLFLMACDGGGLTATNGLKYKLLKTGQGEFAKDGEIVVLNMSYQDQNDSVWLNTADRSPVVVMKDSTWAVSEGIYSIFADLKQGDSAQFSVTATDLFSKTFKTPMPPETDSTSVLTFNIGVAGIYDQEGYRAWQQAEQQKTRIKEEAKAEQQKEEDLATIDAYLQENGIDAQKTETGLSYVITESGTGENATNGALVKVNYTGKVLEGPYFDSSVEEIAKEKGIYTEGRPYGPFEFKLGTGSVIRGWDEGIALLNKGAKATLYIPSGMAYGPRERSAEIGPNSILVFDVELVDITE